MTTPVVQHDNTTREARWPASLVVLVTLLLYITLPQKLTLGPSWLVPVFEIALLAPLSIAVPHRHGAELRWQRYASISLIGIINVANLISLLFLISELLAGGARRGSELILAAVQIWLTNVLIFGLWYWELDQGGPGMRLMETKSSYPDFLFPQMTAHNAAPPDWTPTLLDYLYTAFTNATAFSPTDVLPLTPLAKALMALQAMISLLTIALVAARAVNILT